MKCTELYLGGTVREQNSRTAVRVTADESGHHMNLLLILHLDESLKKKMNTFQPRSGPGHRVQRASAASKAADTLLLPKRVLLNLGRRAVSYIISFFIQGN